MGTSKGEGPAIGIDLGTKYSCVAVWQHNGGEIIVNDQGNRLMPSSVAFTSTETLVGDAAENQAALNPTNTVYGEHCWHWRIACGMLSDFFDGKELC